MKILLFHTQDCPDYHTALVQLNSVLVEEGLRPQVELFEINNLVQAQTLRIPGSPTIRINGEDIAALPHAPDQEFGLGCRLYRHNGRLLGWPPREVLRQAIRKAREAEASLQDEWGDFVVSCCG